VRGVRQAALAAGRDHAKALAGYPFWRVRAGNYRIVYAVAADTLNVLLVGKRNDDEIYRQLRRMVG
jgi:mRNA interferase RelE/StbE